MTKQVASFSMFSSEIRAYETDLSNDLNAAIVRKIENTFGSIKVDLNISRQRKSWLAEKQDDPVNEALHRVFREAFTLYVEELYEPGFLTTFNVYQDWSANILRRGAMLPPHTHVEAMVSMIYYPQHVDGMDTHLIEHNLQRRRTGQLAIGDPQGKAIWHRYLKNEAYLPLLVTPKPGLLLVVPGPMPHYTIPGEFHDRYCVANFITCQSKTAQLMDFSR